MKKILMIGTGGTIASTPTKYGLAPGLTPSDILSYIPAVRQVCEVDSIQVCNLDSTNVTPKHWQLLVRTVIMKNMMALSSAMERILWHIRRRRFLI